MHALRCKACIVAMATVTGEDIHQLGFQYMNKGQCRCVVDREGGKMFSMFTSQVTPVPQDASGDERSPAKLQSSRVPGETCNTCKKRYRR